MAFGFALAISVMIQSPKNGSQSAERPGQPELRAAGRTHTTQLGLAGKGHSAFGFRLDFGERSSYRQTHRDRDVKTITHIGEVADPIRGVERPAHQLAPAGRVYRPRDDERTHTQVSSRLITHQAALDQVKPQLAEPKSVSVVVKARPGQKGHPDITKTRRITVAVFEAETDHPADNE